MGSGWFTDYKMRQGNYNPSREKWLTMTLAEQMGNIGSEVDRIISWKKKGIHEYMNNAFYRAIELLDLTINDKRWSGAKLKETCRLKEVLCDSFYGGKEYSTR